MPSSTEKLPAGAYNPPMPEAFPVVQGPVAVFTRAKDESVIRRRIRYQREADVSWTERVVSQPGCEGLYGCIQCGTCSASCPLAIYMDFTPRRIIQLVREGFHHDVLRSQTIWLCASCYACAVHCPQDIHITDVMYTLKREAIAANVAPKRFPIPVLAGVFYDMVRKHGRTSEFWVVLRLLLRTNPLGFFSMARTGIALLRTRRLSFVQDRIKARGELQALLPPAEEVH
jgi:quinone-modifying oxidoreductase, subunit QmoC